MLEEFNDSKLISPLKLQVCFNLNKEDLLKNKVVTLDVEKEKLDIINNLRKEDNKKEIGYEDIEKFVSISKIINNKIEYEGESEINLDIQKIIKFCEKEIDGKSFNKEIRLFTSEKFNNDFKSKNYDKLYDSWKELVSDLELKKMVEKIGKDNYNKIMNKESEYTNLFYTLKKNSLKILDDSFNNFKSNNLLDDLNLEDRVIFVPDNHIIEIPQGFYGDELKIDSIDIILKDNLDNNVNTKTVSNFEDLSGGLVDAMGGILKLNTSLFPELLNDDNGNLMVSKLPDKKDYLIKLFYSIDNTLYTSP